MLQVTIPEKTTLIFLVLVITLTLYGWGISALLPSRNKHRRRTAGFRVIASGTVLLAGFYLYWRYRYSLNPDALWFAVPLVLAETYAVIDVILFLIMMWKPTVRKALPPLPDAEVDVFITTYNEPVDLVRLTLEGAMRIEWENKHVYVLDDGDRPEFAELADELGCDIITRGPDWQGKPRHAKAGNVNNALLRTSGEFVLILDADQIPDPRIIRDTIGYFRDEKVAFVQTPQHFYNLPPKDPFGSDAPLFYGPILQGKDGWNAAFFCGSNAVLRREALLQLGITEYSSTMVSQAKKTLTAIQGGLLRYHPRTPEERTFIRSAGRSAKESLRRLDEGEPLEEIFSALRRSIQGTDFAGRYPDSELPGLPRELLASLDITRAGEAIPILPLSTISITEDMATSIRLHSLGWKSVFYPEILAYGRAPEDLASALSQRLRWAQGTIQVLVRGNPLTAKGLSAAQKIQYFTTIYSYFSGFASLIFILSPIVFLFTGIAPVTTYSGEFLWLLIPYLLFNRLMFRYVSRGLNVRRGEQYTLSLFPLWIRAVVGVLLGKKPRFVVTPKQRQTGTFLSLVRPQILCILLSLGAVIYGLIMFLSGAPMDPFGVGINVFWAIYNSLSLMTIARAALYKPPAGWEGLPPADIVTPR